MSLLLPSDGLWRGAIYSLEPPAILLAGAVAGPQIAAFPFYAASPPSLAYVAWSVLWLAVVLLGATFWFGRNDL